MSITLASPWSKYTGCHS